MIPTTTTNLPNDYGVDVSGSTFESDGRFGATSRKRQLFVSEQQFLRGTQANITQEDSFSCVETSDSGAVTVADYERCRPLLLVQPILFAVFAMFLIFYCFWCCFKKRQLKRQRQRAVAITTDEQEQRETYRRQLPGLASQRRRERELHRIRLETNARLEKIEGRIAEETNARRILLVEKFKKAGLEKTLGEENFVSSRCEGDTTVRCDETKESINILIKWNRYNGEKPSTFSNECAICLQEYRPNEVIAVSDNPSCSHCYHRDCIVEYLIPRLELESNQQLDGVGDNEISETSAHPSESTTTSHGNKGLSCPCCRLPFLLDPPIINEGILYPSFSSTSSLQ